MAEKKKEVTKKKPSDVSRPIRKNKTPKVTSIGSSANTRNRSKKHKKNGRKLSRGQG